MKVEITKKEQEILHLALERLLQDAKRADEILTACGTSCTSNLPVMEINELRRKIITLTD
jgi:hypothetical protein